MDNLLNIFSCKLFTHSNHNFDLSLESNNSSNNFHIELEQIPAFPLRKPYGLSRLPEVALRIKPLTPEDLEKLPSRFQRQIISTTHTSGQVVVETEKRPIFQFDHVFGPEATQEEVYDKAVINLLEKFLEGYNVTILAYGQTSSGKTYTMGTADNKSVPVESMGIIPRTMTTLFEMINSIQFKSHKTEVKISFVEIYNEDLIDLFGEGDIEERPQIQIREDVKGKIYWTGLKEIMVTNVHEIMEQVGETDMNAKSSRSHAIFSVSITQEKYISHNNSGPPSTPPGSRPGTPATSKFSSRPSSRANSALGKFDDNGDWLRTVSKFHFVDLAGSERLKRTSANGERAKEGISINSGLLALANVISALGDPSKIKHTTHIPYRDSKLTRLLQDSLGGNATTLMIACVSPAEFNLNETMNTLKYANRARNIKNISTVNQEEYGWNDVTHLQSLVIKLRAETTALKTIISHGQQLQSSDHGRVTPTFSTGLKITGTTGRKTPTGIPAGRKTPTPTLTGIPGRKTPTPTGIPGRKTPTTGIPGRITPTSPTSGRIKSSGIPSAVKSSSSVPMKNTNNGRETTNRMRPSSPLATFSHFSNPESQKDRDIEILQEQLLELSDSYVELSQRYAKTSAELAMHQDNYDGLENNPIIEEYKEMVSLLEDRLNLTSSALIQSETLLKETEARVEGDKSTILKLQDNVKDLELQLKKEEFVARIKASRDNFPETFISETIKLLEERLKEREEAYEKLEEKYQKVSSTDDNKSELLQIIEERDQRISRFESNINLLTDEIENLKKLSDSKSNSTNSDNKDIQSLEIELSELKKTHSATLDELQNLELGNMDDVDSVSSTPLTPMTPGTPHNEQNKSVSFNLINTFSKPSHKKSKSLQIYTNGADKRDIIHSSIVEKLQFELQLFESFHKDKTESLNNVKDELEKLEKNHLETLQVVDELREEIIRRDAAVRLKKNSKSALLRSSSPDSYNDDGKVNEIKVLKEELEQQKAICVEYENVIQRLENELKEVKEAQVVVNSRSIIDDEGSSADKLEQYADENVIALEDTVKNLEAQLSKAKEARNSQDLSSIYIIDHTLKTMITLRSNLSDIQQELYDNSKESKILENTKEFISMLQTHLETIRLNIQTKDELIESLKRDSSNQDDELDEKTTEIENLRKRLEEIKNQENETKKQIQSLQASEQSLGEEIISLQASEESLRQEIIILKETESQQGNMISKLQTQFQETKDEKDSIINQWETMKGNYQNQTTLVSKLEGELNLSQENYAENLKKIDEQNDHVTELESKLQAVEKEKDEFTELNKELNNIITEKEKAINEFTITISNLQKDLEVTKNNENIYLESIDNLCEKMFTVGSQVDESIASSDELNDLNIIMKDVQTAKTALSQCELLVSKKGELITKLKFELQDAKNLELTQSKTIKELQNELEEIERKLQQEASTTVEADVANSLTIKGLRSNIEKLSNELEAAKAQESTQSILIRELEDALSKKENSLEELNSSFNDLQIELEKAKEKEGEQAELIQSLESELQNTKNNLNDEISKLKINNEEIETINQRCVNLQNEVENSKNETIQLEKEKNDQIEKVQTELNLLADEFTEVAAKYEDSEEILAERNNRIVELESLLEKSRHQSNESNELNESNAVRQVKLTNVDTDHENYEELLEEKNNRIVELESLLEKSRHQLNESNESNESNDVRQVKLTNVDSDHENYEGLLEERNNRINYEEQLKERNDRITELESLLEKTRQQLNEEKIKLTDISAKYEGSEELLEARNNKITKLESLLEETRNQLSMEQENVNKLKTTVDEKKKEYEITLEKERKAKRTLESVNSKLEEKLLLSKKRKWFCV
ncbi:11142_t:CDS:2 [Diversispora eburnea]|uniref:11142_t:CDS:1 n=1 Tax=Diversispora eburnea TaxID=1213867 RepID=A0A9N8YU34_9GLOM|nr:11142_t:CDS:2 [Diversispora eburnea]